MLERQENKYAEIVLACHEEDYFKAEVVSEFHTLMLLVSGYLKVVEADKSFILGAGDILLMPRNQFSTVIKSSKDGKPYKSIAVRFTPERLKSYYLGNNIHVAQASKQQTRTLAQHPLLQSYFASLLPYFELTSHLPDELATMKIQEGISILRSIDKDADQLLADFAEPGKINLVEFMEKNFMFNLPLEKFSQLTGRSIATFNRDFRKAFQTSPQKWLIQKRLEFAHYQLSKNNRKPVEIYSEAGFENLSHFSFVFKKRFGYTPTELIERGRQVYYT